MSVLIGLDIGTTSLKAACYSLDGDLHGVARRGTPWAGRHSTELDVRRLSELVLSVVHEAADAAPGESVAAVGVAGMAETSILLGADGVPVGPAIAWHDTRDMLEVKELPSVLGADEFMGRTGKPIRPQWSLTKHRWLVQQGLISSPKFSRFGVPEYAVRVLGGAAAAERSLTSRTGWLDLHSQGWWSDALKFSGLEADSLPPLVDAGDPLGGIPRSLSERLRGATLTVAGHDHQAAVIGLGAVGNEIEVDSCGTAEALVRTVRSVDRNSALLMARSGITTDFSVQHGSWSLLGSTEGGLTLHRIRQLLGGDEASFRALDQAAASAQPGTLSVTAPMGGSVDVSGITESATPSGLWRAAIDHVTDDALEVHKTMTSVLGPVRGTIITGGWLRSNTYRAAKLRAFPHATISDIEEAGTRGAAVLAGIAAEILPRYAFRSMPGWNQL